jgi:hypothetical protein
LSSAAPVRRTTRLIKVPNNGALAFFNGNTINETMNGIIQLRKPSSAARFQRTIHTSRIRV